jgi:hypothetical protein
MSQQIQLRRGTSSAWTSANTLLAEGELGLELDTGRFKFGDGVTLWATLPYIAQGAIGATLMIAGEALGGHRAVKADSSGEAVYPDISAPGDGAAIIGITAGSASISASVSVQTSGEMDEPSWTWTPGLPVFADDDGLLTQSVPSGTWIRVIGLAALSTRLVIRPDPAVITA